ncbi:MAG: beta-galactosidase [Anaerolineae bacterium]|nr:beta-galactosidase [Anaerolineae bacterium]
MEMILGVDYYPEHWPETRWATDVRMMRDAGLQVVRLAEFAWAKIEPAEGEFDWDWLDRAVETLASAGLQVVLCTPTAAPPAWLTRNYPDILPVDDRGRRRSFGGRRHYCANSPTYREHTRRIVGAMATRYGQHPSVVGWQIDNEFGGGQTARCYCHNCVAVFRRWLQRRYGHLDTLNEAWGTVFWSQTYDDWIQIEPPGLTVEKPNPSHVLDYYRFSSDSWVDYQQIQIDILRAKTNGAQFVTTNLMGLFSDLDYYKLAQPLDFITWDNYPTGHTERWCDTLYPSGFASEADDVSHAYDVGHPAITGLAHDLVRAMKDKPFWIMEQQPGHVNWGDYNPAPYPGVVRLWTWEDIAHGADTVVYFRWRACLYAQEQYHSGLLRHDGEPGQGLRDVQAMSREQPLMAAIQGTPVRAEVALLHSYDDLWAVDLQPHNRDFGYLRHLFTYYRALQRAGVPVDVAPPTRDLSRYKLVIAPTLFLVDGAIADNLRRYVEQGGHLVLSVRSGFKTTSNRVVDMALPGLLADLVGATVEEWRSLPPGVTYPLEITALSGQLVAVRIWAEALAPVSAEILARFIGGPLDGRPAAGLNRVGKGEVVYLGAWADDALADALLAWLLPRAGVEPVATVPAGVKVMRRVDDSHEFVFLLNFSDAVATVKLSKTGYTDAMTGEPCRPSVEVPARGVAICQRQQA